MSVASSSLFCLYWSSKGRIFTQVGEDLQQNFLLLSEEFCKSHQQGNTGAYLKGEKLLCLKPATAVTSGLFEPVMNTAVLENLIMPICGFAY